MEAKKVYLLLSVVGLVLPYWQFIAWLLAHGVDPSFFLREMLANRVAAFFAADVIVSAIVTIIFIGREAKSATTRWVPTLATLVVGVSLGLPLFLYLRELERERQAYSPAVATIR